MDTGAQAVAACGAAADGAGCSGGRGQNRRSGLASESSGAGCAGDWSSWNAASCWPTPGWMSPLLLRIGPPPGPRTVHLRSANAPPVPCLVAILSSRSPSSRTGHPAAWYAASCSGSICKTAAAVISPPGSRHCSPSQPPLASISQTISPPARTCPWGPIQWPVRRKQARRTDRDGRIRSKGVVIPTVFFLAVFWR